MVVCGTLPDLECALMITSQQEVKIMFFFFFLITFGLIIKYFNQKRIDQIPATYYAYPVLTAKFMGYVYMVLSPLTLLFYSYDFNYDIILGWYALFYFPILTVVFFMPFLWALDRFFIWFGYQSAFDFAKKYREKII